MTLDVSLQDVLLALWHSFGSSTGNPPSWVNPCFALSENKSRSESVAAQVEIYHVRTLHSDCDYQEKNQYKKAFFATARLLEVSEDLEGFLPDDRKAVIPVCRRVAVLKM